MNAHPSHHLIRQIRSLRFTGSLAFCLFAFAMTGNCWLFDKPLDIRASPVINTFAKDQLRFTPGGAATKWIVFQPEVTLELRYAGGITKLIAAKQVWTDNEPIVFELPQSYSKLNSFVLKGNYRLIMGAITPNPKGKHTLPDGTKFDAKAVTGYKIDSKWATQ